jgi:hypothetical protein
MSAAGTTVPRTYPAGIATTTNQGLSLATQQLATHAIACTTPQHTHVYVNPELMHVTAVAAQTAAHFAQPYLAQPPAICPVAAIQCRPPSALCHKQVYECSRNPLLSCHTYQHNNQKPIPCVSQKPHAAATPWAVHSTKQLAAPQPSSPSNQTATCHTCCPHQQLF